MSTYDPIPELARLNYAGVWDKFLEAFREGDLELAVLLVDLGNAIQAHDLVARIETELEIADLLVAKKQREKEAKQ